MTAAARPTEFSQPDARRLVAGAIVGAVGVLLFSAAIGSFVAGTRHGLPITTEPQANALVASAPYLVLGGFVHLAGGALLALGRGLALRLALVVTIGALLAAVARAAMLLTGFDPIGGTDAGHPTTQGVATLVLAAAAYAIAVFMATRPHRA